MVDLDQAVRAAVGVGVRLGALGMDAPALRQGRHDTVKVLIARDPQAYRTIAAAVAESQTPDVVEIETSGDMTVNLEGRHFVITRRNTLGPDRLGTQIVRSDREAVWMFDVLPLKGGRLTLTVSATMRITVPGIAGEKTIEVPTLDRHFRVDVDRVYAAKKFTRSNLKWVIATGVAACGAVAGLIKAFQA